MSKKSEQNNTPAVPAPAPKQIDVARSIYAEYLPRQAELGNGFRQAVLKAMYAAMPDLSVSSAAGMYNKCRLENGGERGVRKERKQDNALRIELDNEAMEAAKAKDPTFGTLYAILNKEGKPSGTYALSESTAKALAARAKSSYCAASELTAEASEASSEDNTEQAEEA